MLNVKKEFVKQMNGVFEPEHIEIEFNVFYKSEYVGVVYATEQDYSTVSRILKEHNLNYECLEYQYFCEEY